MQDFCMSRISAAFSAIHPSQLMPYLDDRQREVFLRHIAELIHGFEKQPKRKMPSLCAP